MHFRSRDPKLLRSLQYFDAVARRGSMIAAAEELGVTPSAVSHQLRELGKVVGEDLIVRRGKGITLTETGQHLAAQLATGFSVLDSCLRLVIGKARPRLRVAVCSAFGPGWLAPRLAGFHAENPGVEVELRLYARDPEHSEAIADCIITARGVKTGFSACDVFEERLLAVASPELCRRSAVGAVPLITAHPEPGREAGDWRGFAEAGRVGMERVLTSPLVYCTHYVLALSLARSGAGVALVPDFLAAEHLQSGALQICFPGAVASARI